MMNIATPLALAATLTIGLFATGCGASLVPFTHELREQNRLTDDEIKNLQFYVSHKITLHRELESGGRQVTGSHKLLLMSGRSIEEVVVEEKTPGIALAVKGSVITVSFEPGTSMDFVVEGARGTVPLEPVRATQQGAPDPFPGNSPRSPELMPERLPPQSLSGNYFLWVEPSGQITFQSKVFDAVEETNQAHLLIDADTLKQAIQNHKVLPGIRLPSK